MNKVVVHFVGGSIQKGYTSDFSMNRTTFHLAGIEDHKTEIIDFHKLKAVFFVKDFEGNPEYTDSKDFDSSQTVYGKKYHVLFRDGEEVIGTGVGYNPNKPGFFLTPCDPDSNILRAFVNIEFISKIEQI
ncbi:MAG: hypothetical protein KAW14_11880 [Candidatus Aegiribacteria sp.]|nr:hypothetical protein [Candidatus Aegiribacteria sp.]